MRVLFTFEGY